MKDNITTLPIYPYLDDIANTLAQTGLLLLTAEPGAGKTTLLPWKMLSLPEFQRAKILLLEPRRLAARAAADRIASLLDEPVGRTVGLRTRLETRVSPATRLEVVTEGVLTRLLQEDPSLAGYGTIVFDEFHTRSLQGDLGLTLAWDARKILRPDMRLALLSATLPVDDLVRVFGPWPIKTVPGRSHPVAVEYCPPVSLREQPWEAAARLSLQAWENILKSGPGAVLCFLPGYREMARARELLEKRLPARPTQIFLLHGQMLPAQQQEILDPAHANTARIILATNVAETSLTIPGVKTVVDIGLERRVRFSPRTGMDHWETRPISQASAEQRQGRAGRTGPGQCLRWWKKSDPRLAYALPEIMEADLTSLVLETSLWGATAPGQLAWFTPPPEGAVQYALGLLQDLGMLDSTGKITSLGRQAAGFSVHPRLAKMVLASQEQDLQHTAAVMAALLENQDLLSGDDPDFRDRVEAFQAWARGNSRKLSGPAAKRVWENVRRILKGLGKVPESAGDLKLDPAAAGSLLVFAYPERVAKKTREENRSLSRWVLASGRGAILKGPLTQADYLVAADLDGGDQDARIFLAAPIPRQEVEQGRAGALTEIWQLEWSGWKPKARLEIKLGALTIKDKHSGLPPAIVLQQKALDRLQEKGLAALPWNLASRRFLARCQFVEKWGHQSGWPEFSADQLLAQAQIWLIPFGTWEGGPVWNEQALQTALENRLGWQRRKTLADLAPESLTLPSGTQKKLDYESGDIPVLAARLQEFFGCQTTPRVCGQPLLLELLSPAGRTVQKTRDLDGFWDRAYLAVKKDLMGRYPRHYWPDNPREAKPTARVKPRNAH